MVDVAKSDVVLYRKTSCVVLEAYQRGLNTIFCHEVARRDTRREGGNASTGAFLSVLLILIPLPSSPGMIVPFA
jgi:hypothetical protein